MTTPTPYLRAVPGQPVVWPYSLRQLQADVLIETNGATTISVAADPAVFRAAPYYLFPYTRADAPATDPRTQRAELADPVLMEGEWRQAWRIRDATTEELAQWDALNAPQPNYDLLYRGLMGSTVYQSYIGRAIASNSNAMPVAMAVLMDALREARTREPIVPAITAALGMVLQAGQFTPSELAELDALLHAANLQDTYSLNP
jgi:hypothetical protein